MGLRRRANDPIYYRWRYPKHARNGCRLQVRAERGRNEICFTFGDFLNLAVLIVGCWWPVRWHGGFAGFDDRTRFIAPTDLGGNGLMQPMKFGVVEVPE
jgi:hypothetical protein